MWVACVGLHLKIETQFILVFLSPDSLLAGHLVLPVSVVDGGGKAVFDRSCWLVRDA